MWQYLRGKQVGTKFRRQYSVDAYVLDFYSPRCKLGIEVDGDSYSSGDAKEYDQQRTTYLNQFGITVIRFTNRAILENIDSVLGIIEETVQRRGATSPDPSFERRGTDP